MDARTGSLFGEKMNRFNNEVYEALINDLIYDSFYIEDRPFRGKIATIRQYSEIILRKIFDIPETEQVTLGKKSIQSQIDSRNNALLKNSVEIIRSFGNDNTHTKNVKSPTAEDFDKVIEALMNLYSYLFIDYFEKYRFGSNEIIMNTFSLLPPVIRNITLQNLYMNDKNNPAIIYKLSLAILKAQDKNTALKWINDEKEQLEKVIHISENELHVIKQIPALYDVIPKNMYEFCINKINDVDEILNNNGILYKTFEEAKSYYEQYGHINGNSPEIMEFNSIMNFCYIGRHKFGYPKDIKSYQIWNFRKINT